MNASVCSVNRLTYKCGQFEKLHSCAGPRPWYIPDKRRWYTIGSLVFYVILWREKATFSTVSPRFLWESKVDGTYT